MESSLKRALTGEDPEEAAGGSSPEAKYAAQDGSHVSAPTVSCSSVQGNNRTELRQDPPAKHQSSLRRSCQSCSGIPDSTHWDLMEPYISMETGVLVYNLSSQAGSYECTVSGLRWVCGGDVTLQYHFSTEELSSAQLEIQLHYISPLMDIKVISGELDEIHLPHSLCLGDSDHSNLSDAVRVLHGDDSRVSLEKCELMRFHARLVKPRFSLWQLVLSLGIPVMTHCEVLIYQSYAEPLILNTYVVPNTSTAKNAIEEEWKSRGGIYIKKEPLITSIRMNSNFKLSTSCLSTIIPEEISLTYNTSPAYFEVCIIKPDDEFEMELMVAEVGPIWKAAVRKGADYKTAMPTRSADQGGAVSLPTALTGEDPEEAASGFPPEAKYAKIVAQGGSHISVPTVTGNTVQGNISINSNIHHHYHGPGVSAPATPPQDPDHTSKIHEYKTSICSTYENVKECNSGPGENVLLADRYTDLLIVETHRKQREREEEIRFRGEYHQQVLKTRASEAYRRITVDQLFKPNGVGDVPKAVILQGHSGHGKSFTVQKIMCDWASGKVFKDLFHLVLHLKCKELNDIPEAHSLVDLLSYCPSFTSETAEVLKDSKMKVLFLIDGFDELKFSFEKTSTVPPKDPFREAPVEATLSALLKGLVLPKCFLLVTTRSTASDKLSKLLSDSQRFTDILGFSEEGVKEYFQRFFKKELLAKKAFDCVRTNETLYTACFIPVICWMTCTVFREQEEESMDITKKLETTTSIFVHFVSTLLEHHCQGLSQPETLLRSLGQLAERGLQEHQVLFDEKSLSEAFRHPSQATKYNPFLCKFLQRKKVKLERIYSFMHLSFQEFFAALQYLMLENEEEALTKLQKLLGDVNRFKPVIQFLFGLSNRDIPSHLKTQCWPSIKAHLQKWLLRVLQNDEMHQGDMLHILHCLYELHEEEFVREAMGVWGEVKFHSIPLTRTDCWVLLYCLQCCPTIRRLALHYCNITAEKLMMLQPALSRCEELGLFVEGLSDADVGDLISALGEEKILTEMSVAESSLSPESVEQVLSALFRQKSVGKVHLSVTTITVPTTALCLDFIQNTETCRYLELKGISWPPSSLSVDKDSRGLRLTVESMSDADVFDLISALVAGKILTELRVAYSSLSPENLELVLGALSRQKSLGDVHLSLTTLNGNTSALCLDFIQNTETCRYLELEDNSWPLSSLSVDKDSRGLRLGVSSLLCSTMSPASLTLSHADNPTGSSFTNFIHNPHRTQGGCIGVLESFTDWSTLPGLEKVELMMPYLTENWAHWILNLIHMCPTLKEVKLHPSMSFVPYGLLLEEVISLLQESYKRPDCTMILLGLRCTKPSGKCGEENNPLLPCNQRVKIQMRGSDVTQEEISSRSIHSNRLLAMTIDDEVMYKRVRMLSLHS